MTTPPNLLIITTHDSGREFGCYGNDTVRTPAIDQLAADGWQSTNTFTTCPQCSPSRGSLLTGQYPQTHGLMGLTDEPWQWSLNQPEHHLSHLLGDRGYDTALIGFQHESDEDDLGYEHIGTSGETAVFGRAKPAPVVADATEAYLEEREDSAPFYAQVNFFETHGPLDYGGVEPDDSQGVTVPPYLAETEQTIADMAQYQGAVNAVDLGVDQILTALDDHGLREDTIVVFTTDHGISFARAKGYLYDPGIAVPLLVHWPNGGIEGGQSDRLVSTIDVLPTLFELAGLDVPSHVEGRSFADEFGREGAPSRDTVQAMFQDHRAWGFGPDARCVRSRDHKLIHNFSPDRRFDVPVERNEHGNTGRDSYKSDPRPPVELYDLSADPLETDNRADDEGYASVRAELNDVLQDWLDGVHDPILYGHTPYERRSLEEYRRELPVRDLD
jgi:arylsulfatase A-like enzyme